MQIQCKFKTVHEMNVYIYICMCITHINKEKEREREIQQRTNLEEVLQATRGLKGNPLKKSISKCLKKHKVFSCHAFCVGVSQNDLFTKKNEKKKSKSQPFLKRFRSEVPKFNWTYWTCVERAQDGPKQQAHN